MKVAFLFPGQGSQRAGMGRRLFEVFPESRQVFEEADRTLGSALSRLCFEGPEAELQLTENTQPAILATSVAALRALAARGLRPGWVAGHSLGEYTAMVAAGVLSLADALRAVRERGRFMQEAVPPGLGAMCAVVGLGRAAVEQACREAAGNEVVSPANLTSPDQIVIAGHGSAVERAAERCKAAGARKVVPLPVSAPFHCALMKPAQQRLEPVLSAIAFRDPGLPLVSNVDARLAATAAECRDGLVRQVASPVRWQESVELLGRLGVTTFVEVGPGSVLSGLVKRILKGVRTLSVDAPESLESALAACGAGTEA